MATLSDFNGDESFTIGGNSFNNRESSGTPIYERTGGDGSSSSSNTLGLKLHAWGIFSGNQGSSNTVFIKHSRNLRFQNIPDGTASGYDAWVLDSPIDMPLVIISASGFGPPTSTTQIQSRMQHNRGRSQIFRPPSEDYGYYTFAIYDISGAEMYESGDTMSPATHTITQAGFNSDND